MKWRHSETLFMADSVTPNYNNVALGHVQTKPDIFETAYFF